MAPNFTSQFSSYLNSVYGKKIKVNWTVYTTNAELWNLMIIAGQAFDVVFPTNYTVDRLVQAGRLKSFNRDWIPNLVNMFPENVNQPFDHDDEGNLWSCPYQWGTTGIGFRTDVFDKANLDVPDGLGALLDPVIHGKPGHV